MFNLRSINKPNINISRFLLGLIFFIVSSSLCARGISVEPATYYCPLAKDIRLVDKIITAFTDYNHIQVKWYSQTFLYEDSIRYLSFNEALVEDCLSGICPLSCVYNTNSHIQPFMSLTMEGKYRIQNLAASWHNIEGAWRCSSSNPENCKFSFVAA